MLLDWETYNRIKNQPSASKSGYLDWDTYRQSYATTPLYDKRAEEEKRKRLEIEQRQIEEQNKAQEKPNLIERIISSAKNIGGLAKNQIVYAAHNPIQAAKNVGNALIENEKTYVKGVGYAFNPKRAYNNIAFAINPNNTKARDYILNDKPAPVTPKEMILSGVGTAIDVGTFGVGSSLVKQGAKTGAKEILSGIVSRRALPSVGIGAAYGGLQSAKEGSTKNLAQNVALGGGLGLVGQAGFELAGAAGGKIVSKIRGKAPDIGSAAEAGFTKRPIVPPETSLNIEWKTGKKAFQQFDAQNNKSVITLPKDVSENTIWHEIAHAADRQKPGLREQLAPEIKSVTGSDIVDNEIFAGAFKKVASNPDLRTQAPQISGIMDSVQIPETVKVKIKKTGNTIIDSALSTNKPLSTDDALSNEARKAEEFVKGQELPQILRGTKGMTAEDIGNPLPNIKTSKDISATDIYGNKRTLPKNEALTPYPVKGKSNILLQDGEGYLVSKNQFQNIKGNTVGGEAKPFAPELEGLEETVKGEGWLTKDRVKNISEETNQWGEKRWKIDFDTGQTYFSRAGMTKEEAIADATNKAIRGKGETTKYSQYTLPGAENYREVLIKAPQSKLPNGITKSGGKYFDAQGTEYSKQDVFGGMKPDFKSSHWDEPNVISHLRLNERTYKGKKVTFMEELQSDWAREGRDKGFTDSITKDTAKQQGFIVNKAKASTGGEAYFIDNPKDEYFYRKGFTNTGFDTEAEAWSSVVKKLKERTIPSNPNLKNWQELSIKRALKDAVDNNSDYFAWINGEQTSARYNLAKDLEYTKWKTTDTAKEFGADKIVELKIKQTGNIEKVWLKADGTIIRGPKSDWAGQKLDQAIGKGLADKIMAKESGTLAGEGLKFGGEWANNLYDKQTKNIVEDLTGQKVEMLDMGLPIEGKGQQVWFDTTEPYSFNSSIGNLKPEGLKIRKEIVKKENRERYIITDILGDGKFKAVPKKIQSQRFGEMEVGKDIKLNDPTLERDKQTFDISQKTTQQMGIRLTPEVKAKIQGKAPDIKTSGKMFEDAKPQLTKAVGVKVGATTPEKFVKGQGTPEFNNWVKRKNEILKKGGIQLERAGDKYVFYHAIPTEVLNKVDNIRAGSNLTHSAESANYLGKVGKKEGTQVGVIRMVLNPEDIDISGVYPTLKKDYKLPPKNTPLNLSPESTESRSLSTNKGTGKVKKRMSEADKLLEYERQQGISTAESSNSYAQNNLDNTNSKLTELRAMREDLLNLIKTSDNPDIHRKALGTVEDRINALNKDEKVFSNRLNKLSSSKALDTTDPRNFRSAEEFVNAQGILVYHGTNKDFSIFDNTKLGSTQGFDESGFFFTDNLEKAKTYNSDYIQKLKFKMTPGEITKNKNLKTIEAYVDTNGFISMSDLNKMYEKGLIKTKPDFSKSFRPESFFDNNRQSIKEAVQNGVKGIKHTAEGETVYMVADPSKIKTKSQLTDIWNEAQSLSTNKAIDTANPRNFATAEEFVKAQGEPVYHGTGEKFEVFDTNKLGTITGAKSAKGALWFTDDPATAKAYSIYAAEEGPVKKALDEATKLEKIAQKSGKQSDWAKYDKMIVESERLAEYDNTFVRRQQANVMEVNIPSSLKIKTIDAKGKTPQDLSVEGDIDSWLNLQVENAKKAGFDGLKIKNLDDAVGLYNKPATHYAIFDPSKIKTKSQLTEKWNKSRSLSTNKGVEPKNIVSDKSVIPIETDTSNLPSVEGFTTSKYYKGDPKSRYGRKIQSQKINSQEDIQQLNQELNDKYTQLFQDIKGGRKPNEVVKKEAEALGWNLDKIKSLPDGALLNDSQTVAVAQIKADLTLELAETAKAFKQSPSNELKGKMNDLVSKILYTDAVTKRSETYLGRAIQAKNVTPIPREFDDSIMDILDKAGINNVTDLKSATSVADKLGQASLKDAFWSVYYNSILSGTSTHIKNFSDTGFNTMIEQGLEILRHPANIKNQLKGVGKGFIEGLAEAKDIFTGKVPYQTKYDLSDKNFKNNLIRKIEVVGRALAAEDALWKNVNKKASISSLAYEQARKEGLGTIRATIKAKDYISNPSQEMIDQAVKESLRNTYNQKPEGWVGAMTEGWGKVTQKAPVARFIQPFTRIVGNVLNAGIDWTPAGLKRAVEYKLSGGEFANREFTQQLGRSVLGTMGMAYAFNAAMDGFITGSGPSNTNERKQLESTGWQANSVKIGDKYYSYQNLGAWGLPLALVANYADAKKYNKLDDQETDKRLAYAIFGTASTITDKSFLSNIKQLFDAMKNNDPKYMQRFGSRVATSWYPNLAKQIGNYFSPEMKDPDSLWDYVKNSFGYPINKKVQPKLDVFGETQKDTRSIIGRIMGTNIVSDKSGEMPSIMKRLTDNDITLSIPTKTTKITDPGQKESRTMSDDELRNYKIIYGQNLKRKISSSNEILMRLSGEKLEKKVADIIEETREKSKKELIKNKLRK